MSNIEQFPQIAYYIIAPSELTELGSYDNVAWGDLELAHVRIYHKQVAAYDYDMRLIISSKAGGPTLAASDWLEFSNTTTGQATEFWLGNVTFLFSTNYALIDGEEYFVSLEVDGYTRPDRPNENDSYLGIWSDWLEPIGNANDAGARIAFGVRR